MVVTTERTTLLTDAAWLLHETQRSSGSAYNAVRFDLARVCLLDAAVLAKRAGNHAQWSHIMRAVQWANKARGQL